MPSRLSREEPSMSFIVLAWLLAEDPTATWASGRAPTAGHDGGGIATAHYQNGEVAQAQCRLARA